MYDFFEKLKWFKASKFLDHSSPSKPTTMNCEPGYFSDQITEKFFEKSDAVYKIQSKCFKKDQKATISKTTTSFFGS